MPLIVIHGETLAEPVAPGTNRAALEADIDILAHPGLITLEEAALARERGIFLEISARKGHCLANGHVARTALEVGASLIVDTDSHGPGDLITRQQAERIAQGAGLTGLAIANPLRRRRSPGPTPGRAVAIGHQKGGKNMEMALVQRTYTAVLEHLIKTGRAPHYTELGKFLGLPPDDAKQAQRAAAESSIGCWFVKDTDYVESWAPFSNVPTHYLVTIKGEQKWYGQ